MAVVAGLVAAVSAMVVTVGLILSRMMTHRFGLTEIQTPADYGLPFEEVTFSAADGLRLRGWWIPAHGSERAVIVMHGHGESMDWDVHRAPVLHDAGFGVLLFDFRAHGQSPGHLVTLGYLERRDVQGAVEFLKRRSIRRIGLLGFSLGARVATMSAPICPEVVAVVGDGTPARMSTAAAARGVEWGLPGWLTRAGAWLTLVFTCLRVGANLFHYEPVRWVGRISPRPILFIHGDQDQYCPDFDDLCAAAREPKELWRVRYAGHTTLSATNPAEHQQRVLAFFEKYL